MNIRCGISPFDTRVGGLRAGGTYLLAGAPGVGKLTFILQFLAEGLKNDERVGLLCGAAPEEIFELAGYWGIELESAWNSDRLVLLGFRGEYPRRILHAPEPAVAFEELTELLDGSVSRLGVDPGTLLWETRAGTAMAHHFLSWTAALETTTIASLLSDMHDGVNSATEWVLQRAAGVFHIARLPTGRRELSVYRMHPPVDIPGPITLELRKGAGFVAPSGQLGRRRSDLSAGNDRRLLLLRLSERVPGDLDDWLRRDRELTEVADTLELAARLSQQPQCVVCLYVDRYKIDEAVEVCRFIRELSAVPVVLVSDEQLRSTDRASAMNAGADDVLFHNVSLRELDSRIRRAAAGRREAAEVNGVGRSTTLQPITAVLNRDAFASALRDRLGSEEHGLFTLVRVKGKSVKRIRQALRENIRADAGDFVGTVNGGYGIVLQDARTGHVQAFVERVRSFLADRDGGLESLDVEVLTSPTEAERIETLLGE